MNRLVVVFYVVIAVLVAFASPASAFAHSSVENVWLHSLGDLITLLVPLIWLAGIIMWARGHVLAKAFKLRGFLVLQVVTILAASSAMVGWRSVPVFFASGVVAFALSTYSLWYIQYHVPRAMRAAY